MPRPIKTLTKETNWTSDSTDTEMLKLSCLMRIADAVETLTKKYADLERDLDFYRREYHRKNETIDHLHRSRAAVKAHLTRMKNAAKDRSPKTEDQKPKPQDQ